MPAVPTSSCWRTCTTLVARGMACAPSSVPSRLTNASMTLCKASGLSMCCGMIIPNHLPVVKGHPPSWAWCIDPDWRALAARAVTAPAWAGPKGVPCFGRPTLDCRCTTCRAGRPYLRYSLHLLQGALAVEPADTLAIRVGAAGEQGLLAFLFRQA